MHLRRLVAACLLVLATGCSGAGRPFEGAAPCTPWPEADRLFRQDPRWLGGDAAYSIDMGDDRVLWLFGDSFIATTPAGLRTESEMVRNTIAVQIGRDPTTAAMTFAWGRDPDGSPAPYFPAPGAGWVWPLGGARLPSGEVVVFLSVNRETPGQGLGFAPAGWAAARLTGVDGPPATWARSFIEPPPQAFDAQVGTAIAVDGDHVVLLAVSRDPAHHGYLARLPAAALAAGDLGALRWWDGAAWAPAEALRGAPARVLAHAGPEASLHRDPDRGLWIHVATRGFGASAIAVRTAPEVTGPWSPPRDVCVPPESLGPRPFVYAAKAHPELAARGLVVSYAASSLTFGDLVTAGGAARLYWPRLVRVDLDPPRAR